MLYLRREDNSNCDTDRGVDISGVVLSLEFIKLHLQCVQHCGVEILQITYKHDEDSRSSGVVLS